MRISKETDDDCLKLEPIIPKYKGRSSKNRYFDGNGPR